MARALHILWIVFVVSAVGVTLSGCPRRPEAVRLNVPAKTKNARGPPPGVFDLGKSWCQFSIRAGRRRNRDTRAWRDTAWPNPLYASFVYPLRARAR